MAFDEDSPANPKKDMSEHAVMRRYERANLMAIVTTSRFVFESLADIPKLVDERKELLTELKKYRSVNVGGSTDENSVRDDEKNQSEP